MLIDLLGKTIFQITALVKEISGIDYLEEKLL